ncbi:MAG: RNA methyltransferase [Candidatus Micrarchaeia archaeon]
MDLKVVMVEPEYQINIGYIARISKNFGVKKLAMVNPKCKYNGKNAIMYAKHAKELITNAELCSSLDEALKGYFVIGSTGIWHKTNASFYNVVSIEKIKSLIKGKKKIALVLGREGTGLTREELQRCDVTAFIPASRSYPILNISHALAIMLYELNKEDYKELKSFEATPADISNSTKLFYEMIKDKGYIKNKEAVKMAFEHILKRASPTKKELNAIALGLNSRSNKK